MTFKERLSAWKQTWMMAWDKWPSIGQSIFMIVGSSLILRLLMAVDGPAPWTYRLNVPLWFAALWMGVESYILATGIVAIVKLIRWIRGRANAGL